jgi:hypothetical protein
LALRIEASRVGFRPTAVIALVLGATCVMAGQTHAAPQAPTWTCTETHIIDIRGGVRSGSVVRTPKREQPVSMSATGMNRGAVARGLDHECRAHHYRSCTPTGCHRS